MSRRKARREAAVSVVLVGVILVVSSASAGPGDVQVGMSEEQVVRLLREPDRKAVLVGKELHDAERFSAEDRARLRLVYIYDSSGLQVWFRDGKVTGVTRHGRSVR